MRNDKRFRFLFKIGKQKRDSIEIFTSFIIEV